MRSISLYLRSVTRALTLISALSIASFSSASAQDVKAGAAIFKQKCTSCHAIDKKVVGPALKGINERHDEAWLIKWTKNAPAMIASGDPAAKKLYEENKPAMMTAFSELSDDDVKSIYAYIKAEENKPAAAAGAAAPGAEGAHAEAQGGSVSNFMLIGLIAVVVIAFLVIVVLNRVIGTLERLIMKKQGVEVEEEEEGEKKEKLAGLKKLAKNKKFLFFVVLLVVIVLGSFGWMTMWNTNVQTGYQPVQPIKFSHQLHAGINKIDCQYCHTDRKSVV